ncbi:MAG TPA: addiction module protein [Acidobacteriota bacterium]
MAKPDIDIASLTNDERLRLIEELWNSFRENPDAVPLTEAQRSELDRRLDEMERDGGEGIPWEEVLQRIRQGGR